MSSQNIAAPTAPVVIDLGVTPRATVALAEVPYDAALQNLLVDAVEADSGRGGTLVADIRFHPMVAAIHAAFADHRPLILSPDIIWLLIAQGFAHHVNANAEELRPRFVAHPGKVRLEVRRDEFIKGSPANDWSDVFGEFSGQIRQHLGDATYDLLLPRFSTTGATEIAVAQVVLLDAMQSYFAYLGTTVCGIPEIVLEGTADDWHQLARRTRDLGRFGLTWWTSALEPVLKEFVAAARGRVDLRFWRSIYKLDDSSGGPYVNGWVLSFFPYLMGHSAMFEAAERARTSGPPFRRSFSAYATEKNELLTDNRLREALLHPSEYADVLGTTTDHLPGGLASVPFEWRYLGATYAMEFLAGFVGVRQERETLRLRPEIGWAVRERHSQPTEPRSVVDE